MVTTENQPLFIGTELKLSIHVDPIGGMTMADYDFEVEVYCSSKKSIIIPKTEAVKTEDDNTYIILVDTNAIGTGNIKCKLTAQIPDNDFPDDFRTEVVCVDTGINIIKTL